LHRATGLDAHAIKRQIAAIDRKLEAAAERLLAVEASLVPVVHTAMQKLKAERQALEGKLTARVLGGKNCQPQTAAEGAAGLWKLDEILRNGDPVKVRRALVQIIDSVTIDFASKPMLKQPKRVRWVPVGGSISLCSERGLASGK